ncbi:hypothetical protein ACJX0J_032677, partial [Zea mays]
MSDWNELNISLIPLSTQLWGGGGGKKKEKKPSFFGIRTKRNYSFHRIHIALQLMVIDLLCIYVWLIILFDMLDDVLIFIWCDDDASYGVDEDEPTVHEANGDDAIEDDMSEEDDLVFNLAMFLWLIMFQKENQWMIALASFINDIFNWNLSHDLESISHFWVSDKKNSVKIWRELIRDAKAIVQAELQEWFMEMD